MSKLNVNAIEPSTGTDITLGASGDTITVPSGATFTQSGTMNASAITAGTMATARLGSGTADATTFLRGDQSYAAAGFTPSGASAYPASTQSIPDETWTKVTLGTEYYDTNGEFADSKYTVVTAGNYLLSGVVAENGEASTNVRLSAAIYKNGALFIRCTVPVSGGYEYCCEIAALVVPLSADDYIELYYFHNKGSALTINGLAGATYLNVLRVT